MARHFEVLCVTSEKFVYKGHADEIRVHWGSLEAHIGMVRSPVECPQCRQLLYTLFDEHDKPRIMCCRTCKTAKSLNRPRGPRVERLATGDLPGIAGQDWNDGDPKRHVSVQGYTQ